MNKTVDLFAGCGGLSLGFQNAGFEIMGAFELWDTAVTCYEKNFSHPVFRTDLSDVAAAVSKIKDLAPDIIIGGPPCQDFSHAGKRIEAGRASLTSSFAKIVAGVRPSYFVMENVDRTQKSEAHVIAGKIFKESGYGLTEITLDASFCGAPQKRKRFFLHRFVRRKRRVFIGAYPKSNE
jgi:DNA (cytosine-5)-methyltransferase 1